MPKYQKISDTEKTITFNVFSVSDETAQVTYGLSNSETEEQLMSRVANHFESCIKERNASVEMPKEEIVYPIKEALPMSELVSESTHETPVSTQAIADVPVSAPVIVPVTIEGPTDIGGVAKLPT